MSGYEDAESLVPMKVAHWVDSKAFSFSDTHLDVIDEGSRILICAVLIRFHAFLSPIVHQVFLSYQFIIKDENVSKY